VIHYTLSDLEFESTAMELFKIQATENSIYKRFLDLINVNPENVNKVNEIPFLPIQLFKFHTIKTGDWNEQKVFLSSGTTQQIRSRHFVRDEKSYLSVAVKGFESVFGDLKEWIIIAYLPGYTENPSSSLISMVDELIRLSNNELSGFVEFDAEKLIERLQQSIIANKKVMLVGVAFALLDFVKANQLIMPELFILETGGMKGRGENFTRDDLHKVLSENFGTQNVYSEYGMTELFSQAYTTAKTSGFFGIKTLKALIKDINDPMEIKKNGRYGVLNFIDLANVDTCAFIATQDIGLMNDDGSFEVIGRIDNADVRGCNLLYFQP
jgi:hypothetical protein